MAIAFDNTALVRGASGTTITLASYTVSSSSNRILFVGSMFQNVQITSMTYNGVAMTLLDSYHDTPNLAYSFLYYLVNPTSGSHDIVANLDGSPATNAILLASSYTGVKQTSSIDNHAVSYPATVTNTYSQSLTSTADNCWGIWLMRDISGHVKTAGTNTTNRQNDNTTFGLILADTNGDQTPAGTVTMNESVSSGGSWTSMMATFAPIVNNSGFNIAFV